MQTIQSRRRFLESAAWAGAAGLIGTPRSLHAEPPPETTTVRIPTEYRVVCEAPKSIAGELLRDEGFTDVRYVDLKYDVDQLAMAGRGELDFVTDFPRAHIAAIDAGVSITVLAGLHSGCLELIANDSIHSVKDLRGKKIGVDDYTSYPHLLLTLMMAEVGLDPESDVQWVKDPKASSMELFADGKIDAFLNGPPEPQELRARKIGHTILNTAVDRPWSQYFCCMLCGNTGYVSKYPVATKRVLRAILKTADLCASDPGLVARRLVDGHLTDRYDYALQALTEARYDRWREFDPEDTLRFYALRMREAEMIKSDPNKIIASGTDWRFLDELKRELKT